MYVISDPTLSAPYHFGPNRNRPTNTAPPFTFSNPFSLIFLKLLNNKYNLLKKLIKVRRDSLKILWLFLFSIFGRELLFWSAVPRVVCSSDFNCHSKSVKPGVIRSAFCLNTMASVRFPNSEEICRNCNQFLSFLRASNLLARKRYLKLIACLSLFIKNNYFRY
jgi:hypothetical protein